MSPRAGWEHREGGPFGYGVYRTERGGVRFTGVVRRLAKGGRVEFFVRRVSLRPFAVSEVVVRGDTLLSVPAARRLVEAICREDAPLPVRSSPTRAVHSSPSTIHSTKSSLP